MMIDTNVQKNKEFLKMVDTEKSIAKDYQKRLWAHWVILPAGGSAAAT